MPDFIDRLGADLGSRRELRAASIASEPPQVARAVVGIDPGAGAADRAGVGGPRHGGRARRRHPSPPGAPAGPKVPPVPTAGNGAATAATAKLLPLRVADPAGGLRWGLRSVRTTRGDICLQVGRLADGTIGAIGEDGAFGNDRHFHPFSDNYEDPLSCVPLDARGHGFTTVVISGLPTSAMDGGGCLADFSRHDRIPCPVEDTRDVYFGLLGPEASSITYASAGGQPVTVPTVGPDGAYLIVTRALLVEQQGEASGFGICSRQARSGPSPTEMGTLAAPRPWSRAPAPDSWPPTPQI